MFELSVNDRTNRTGHQRTVEKDSIQSNNFIYFLSSLKTETSMQYTSATIKAISSLRLRQTRRKKLAYNNRPNVFFALVPEIAVINQPLLYRHLYGHARQLEIPYIYSVSDQHVTFRARPGWFCAAMALGLIFFMLAGASHTNNVLKPIDEITEVTKKISGENLNLRISEKSSKSELNELAGTINDMMDRIQISYEKQKRFVSDVSTNCARPYPSSAATGPCSSAGESRTR
jgi:methyl-accepting chemotaxis protein